MRRVAMSVRQPVVVVCVFVSAFLPNWSFLTKWRIFMKRYAIPEHISIVRSTPSFARGEIHYLIFYGP